MTNPEKKANWQITNSEPTPLPARVEDDTHQVLVQKNESGTLFVRVAQGEQMIFTAAVSNEQDVSLAFADGRRVIFPAHQTKDDRLPQITNQQGEEQEKTPEHPPITLEGYPVRPAKYTVDESTGKKAYKLIIAHHPNPKERKQVVYYDLAAEGAKAEECFKAGITDTRVPVHATGDDLSRVVRKKDGSEKIVHAVRVDSLEKIRERRVDSPDILREKVRLRDKPKQE
jgi:hypothetical protein